MSSKINTDKIFKELSKGTPEEMFDTLSPIKEFVQKALTQKQLETEDAANELQKKIQEIVN